MIKSHNHLVYWAIKGLYKISTCSCFRKKRSEKKNLRVFDTRGSVKALNYQLNFLMIWISICFSSAIVDYLNIDIDKYNVGKFIVIGFSILSVFSGLLISHYLNKRYESNLMYQISSVFQ